MILLNEFIETLDEYLAPLAKSIEELNYPDMEYYAHKLRGSSTSYDFDRLSGLLETIENHAGETRKKNYSKILLQINEELDTIRKKINGWK